MKPGSFKLVQRGSVHRGPVQGGIFDPIPLSDRKMQRVIDSLRSEIIQGGGGHTLRIRQIFQTPREIYRLELELPELGYQRTTLLDRDALEELLEVDEVRAIVRSSPLGS
jgi:hypothetical protein